MARSVVGLRPLLGVVLLAFGCSAAQADDVVDRWRFGSAPDGSITASVFADSIIAIGSGALGYRPVLTIACRPDGEPQWSEWLQLNDGVAGGNSITVAVSLDRGENVKEKLVGVQWFAHIDTARHRRGQQVGIGQAP